MNTSLGIYIAYFFISLGMTIWVARTLHKILFLRVGEKPTDLVEGVEYISTKLGIVMLALGGMHFFNMFNFSKMRKKAIAHNPPPVPGEKYAV
jgi:uncharacterized integral membrane protein